MNDLKQTKQFIQALKLAIFWAEKFDTELMKHSNLAPIPQSQIIKSYINMFMEPKLNTNQLKIMLDIVSNDVEITEELCQKFAQDKVE